MNDNFKINNACLIQMSRRRK